MKLTNLGIVIKDSKILLCMKKRWFWAWLLNSAWWKLEACESMEDCMIRELKEETNIDVKKEWLDFAWILFFHFPFNPDWSNECHLFRINDFSWVPEETEEMKPEWFDLDNIPYEKMWKDDPIWLPRIIDWEYIEYEISFDKDWNVIDYKKLK